MNYKNLTDVQRYDISIARYESLSLRSTANRFEYSKSTVTREIRRYTGLRGYRPKQSHELAVNRRKARRGRVPPAAETWARCRELLCSGHSPEQATGRAQAEGHEAISHETIYQRVYGDKAK